ncbi:MAG: hypothetical protein V4713_03840 [Pseudomonadota bacterium]
MHLIDLKDVSPNPSNPRAIDPHAADPIATVKKLDTGDEFTCIAGARRLAVMLEVNGVATVTVSPTGEVLEVRELNGQLVASTLSPARNRATWNDLYAKRISERTDLDAEKAMQLADSADDAFNDGEDPVEAADEELTNWND